LSHNRVFLSGWVETNKRENNQMTFATAIGLSIAIPRSKDDKRTVAIHESGHAVAGLQQPEG